MEILGVELTLFQISLIIALFVIGPLGYYNQRRRTKKNEEEENLFAQYSQQSSQDETDQESQQIISYIKNYKDSYSKDAIRTALVNNGNTQEKIDSLIEKYF